MRSLFRITTLLCMGLVSPLWAQVGNSVLTGSVVDPSKALIPGVSITAVNTQTGVQTVVLTNESGAYNIPNLIPGVYTLRGSLPGFQPQTFQNIDLGGNQTRRFNFTLQLAATQTQVEVTVDAQQLLTQSGGTVGDVLPEASVRNLPLVGNDVLDLINVLGGVQLAPPGTLTFGTDVNQSGGASRWTTLAGVSATFVNTNVNGLTVTDSFYAGAGEPDNTSGILSVTRINPDLIGEVRLILTPVDAEMGRGNGQIQLTTRSGTNRFNGSARWDIRNPALNARTWAENSILVNNPGCSPTERGSCVVAQNWYNQNEFTVSYGGPIVRNKTFFFALYDQQIHRARTPVNNTVLSPCARNGIFRYVPGLVNGNFTAPESAAVNSPQRVVGVDGTPLFPVRYVSVFGPIDFATFPSAVAPDCSNIRLVNGTLAGASTPANAWDTNRWNSDPTGFVAKVFAEMPAANNYELGDGLNTAGNRYVRSRKGADGGSVFGTGTPGDNTNRKQINLKIDHNFTSSHKVATQWSYEHDDAQGNEPNYQQGFRGSVQRRPLSLSANFSSTLAPSMVNEFRFGLRRSSNKVLEAFDSPGNGTAAKDFFPAINGIPVEVDLPIIGSPMMATASPSQSNAARTLTFADTFSWTRNKHAFRFGGEFRANHADVFGGYNVYTYPRLTAGPGSVPVRIPATSCGGVSNCDFQILLNNNANYGNGDVTHFRPGNLTNLENVLLLQSGSIGNMRQFYWVQDVDRLDAFESFSSAATKERIWLQRESALFLQDDWKMTQNLTLNLGVRWEYYGPPWEARGMLPTPAGSNLAGAFGISGSSWDDWWQANPTTKGNPTVMEHVGPGSPNPDRSIYNKDRNNFGPVVGFAWNPSWFGEGKTVVRGGYSITYQGGGNFAALDGTAGEVPGSVYDQGNFQAATNTYIRLSDFGTAQKSLVTPATFNFRDYPYKTVVPLPANPSNAAQAFRPMSPVPMRVRPLHGIPTEFFDDNYLAPYIQNFTFSVTRNIGRNMSVDVRYVATVARKLFSEQPVNSPNFLTNGLKGAFDAARRGDESQLLNDLTSSVNGAFGGSGATWLRNQTAGCFTFPSISMADSLALGHYADVADCLAYTNGTLLGEPGEQGLVLKRSVNARFPNGAPDNFIVANPQFGNLNIVTNANKSNYHSLQTQFTLRPTHGFSYQGTFTWSRLMGSPSATNMFQSQGAGLVAYYSMDRRNEDYGVLGQHRRLDYRSHGTFVLPVGPNKLLFGNTSGWVARALEDWQVTAIFNLSTGIPMTIVGRSGLYESRASSNFALFGFPTTVAPADLTPAGAAMFGNFHGEGEMEWKAGAPNGTYFPGVTFARVNDPQCNGVTTQLAAGISLQDRCRTGLSALAVVNSDGTQTIVLQNAQPATRGNLGVNTMEGPAMWSLDGSLSKMFRITESKRFQLRFDASNILNHPIPCAPTLCPGDGRGTNLALNPFGFAPLGAFGLIGNKSLSMPRQFQATVRFDF